MKDPIIPFVLGMSLMCSIESNSYRLYTYRTVKSFFLNKPPFGTGLFSAFVASSSILVWFNEDY